MRRRPIRVEEDDSDINLTPMLDIVFIMLIFFVVTTSFVKESGIEINRPGAVTAERKERASILIAIDDNGRVWMDRRQIDIRAVRANIERVLAENPQGSVVIQADKESRNGVLVRVMDSARQAGVESVSIAAEKRQE